LPGSKQQHLLIKKQLVDRDVDHNASPIHSCMSSKLTGDEIDINQQEEVLPEV
jgi:hypothetical protein